MLGYHWLDGFLKRNPQVTIRKSESLSQARAIGLNSAVVGSWFDELGTFLREKNVMNKGEKIWNFDETGIQLTCKAGEVVAEKGAKVVSSLTPAEKGETVTVAACTNSLGNYIPPMVLFKGKKLSSTLRKSLTSAPNGSLVTLTESGYITSETMVQWGEHFCKYKPQGTAEEPDILLLDGHSTHVFNIEFLNIMSSNNVEVFALPPHTTHALQPLDKSFFKPLKSKWDQLAQKMFRLDPQNVSRSNFLKLFNECWMAVTTVSNAQSGFRSCGIVPFDPSVLSKDVFQPSLATERPFVRSPDLTSPCESYVADGTAKSLCVSSEIPAADGANADYQMPINAVTTEDLLNTESVCHDVPYSAVELQTQTSTSTTENSHIMNSENRESSHQFDQPVIPKAQTSKATLVADGDEFMDSPTKVLHQISPIPTRERSSKRRKKLMSVYRLTSDVHKDIVRESCKKGKTTKSTREGKAAAKRKTQQKEQDNEPNKRAQSSAEKRKEKKPKKKYPCGECGGVYNDPSDARKHDDWLSCPTCGHWLHESCFLSHDC